VSDVRVGHSVGGIQGVHLRHLYQNSDIARMESDPDPLAGGLSPINRVAVSNEFDRGRLDE
jgi:hypothetical protein